MAVGDVFGRIADRETEHGARIFGRRRPPDRPERQLESPEDQGRDDAEQAVENDLACLARVPVIAVEEDPALVEDVLHGEADDRPRGDRDRERENRKGAQDELLRAQIHQRRHRGEQRIANDGHQHGRDG